MGDNTPKKMERVLRDPRPLRELDATCPSQRSIKLRTCSTTGGGTGARTNVMFSSAMF